MYYNNPEIELVGIVDKDFFKATEAAKKWNSVHYSEGINSVTYPVDIISVCIPTHTHKQVLIDVMEHDPKIVIAEKPFCNNSQEAEEVIEAYKKVDIPIIINYSRRYVPEIQQLKRQLQEENFGKIYSATFHYTRGLKHEGCHAIDLCIFLFGEFINGTDANLFEEGIIDRDRNDRTIACFLKFEKVPWVFLSPCDGRQYKVFQLEIMTEAGKIILSQHGMYIDFYGREKENIWGDFDILSKNLSFRMSTNLNRSLEYLGKEIVNYLQYGIECSCTAYDALQVHQIIEHLKHLKGE
jgi:predicted dehydrogenase